MICFVDCISSYIQYNTIPPDDGLITPINKWFYVFRCIYSLDLNQENKIQV